MNKPCHQSFAIAQVKWRCRRMVRSGYKKCNAEQKHVQKKKKKKTSLGDWGEIQTASCSSPTKNYSFARIAFFFLPTPETTKPTGHANLWVRAPGKMLECQADFGAIWWLRISIFTDFHRFPMIQRVVCNRNHRLAPLKTFGGTVSFKQSTLYNNKIHLNKSKVKEKIQAKLIHMAY